MPALRDDRFLWSGFFTPMHTQTHAYMHPPRPRRRRCCSLLFSWSMYGRRLPQEHICVDACGGCNVRHRWCRTETAPPPPLHKSLNRQGTLRTRAPCHVRDGQGRTSRVGAVPGIGSGARILKLATALCCAWMSVPHTQTMLATGRMINGQLRHCVRHTFPGKGPPQNTVGTATLSSRRLA